MKVIVVCRQCQAILACVDGGDRWDCAVCELRRPRIFHICPWNLWGGKQARKLNGEKSLMEICLYCSENAGKSGSRQRQGIAVSPLPFSKIFL